MAAAAVGEHRPAGAAGQRRREVAPGGDAAQALVEQHDRRRIRHRSRRLPPPRFEARAVHVDVVHAPIE